MLYWIAALLAFLCAVGVEPLPRQGAWAFFFLVLGFCFGGGPHWGFWRRKG